MPALTLNLFNFHDERIRAPHLTCFAFFLAFVVWFSPTFAHRLFPLLNRENFRCLSAFFTSPVACALAQAQLVVPMK